MNTQWKYIGCGLAVGLWAVATPLAHAQAEPETVPPYITRIEPAPEQVQPTPAISLTPSKSTPGKPQVCAVIVPPKGKFAGRPNVQALWEHYLHHDPEGIWSRIGGMVEVNGNLPFGQGRWENACTVRMSYMLNRSWHFIPDDGDKTVSGGEYDEYYFRLKDMKDYFFRTFGEPDTVVRYGFATEYDIPPVPGLILMEHREPEATGHTTIWNGKGSVDGAEIIAETLYFWELPCYPPGTFAAGSGEDAPRNVIDAADSP